MRKLTVTTLLVAAAVSTLIALPANAKEHRVKKLGSPRTCFNQHPLKSPDDLRTMLHKKKKDVQTALQKAGWTGSVDDIDRAAQDPNTKIGEASFQTGSTIPYMAYRKHGKPDVLSDVVWEGNKPIEAYTIEFDSTGKRYRLTAPKQCGNFWIEEIQAPGGPAMIQPEGVSVSVAVPAEICVTQPADVTVTAHNAAPNAQVTVSVEGQPPITGTLSGDTFQAKLGAYKEPGQHEVTAMVGDAKGTAVLTVKPCPPMCSLTVTPAEIRRGKVFTVDASGSRVAPGVTVGIRSVTVEVVHEGTVVDHFDLTPPALRRDDVVIKKAGAYTIRAVATDEAGQKSSNACEAAMTILKPPFPLFIGGFVGKERLVRDDFPGGHCAALVGAELGVLPEIAENVAFEAAVGGKVNVQNGSKYSSALVDFALNYMPGKAIVGAGVSFWDLTHKDTRTAYLLVQGGATLTDNGEWQFLVEGRIPFNKFDNVSNNYQVWGGLRFLPFGR